MCRIVLLFVGVSALVLGSSAPGSCQDAGARWRYSKLDVVISIAPQPGTMHMVGDAEVELTGAACSDLRLRLNGNWYTLDFVSLSVPNATVKINITDPSHKGWRIAEVHFSNEVKPGARVPIRFEVAKARDGFPLTVKPQAAVAIQDAGWYPVPLGGSTDLPPGKLIFNVPLEWHVASVGELVSQTQQGSENVEVFQAGSNRARGFIAAPYKIRESHARGHKTTLYLLEAPVDDVALLAAFEKARDFLEALYGKSPFVDYRIAEMPNDIVPWYGASEEGLIISRNQMMRSEEGLLGNLVHEYSHSWWGNEIRPTGSGSVLLDEGMASFSGFEFWASFYGLAHTLEGLEFGSANGSPDTTIYGYMELWRGGKDVPVSHLKQGVGDDYNIAQSKGVWVLRMLADRIGKDRFFATARGLIGTQPDLNLPAFRAAMTSAAPEDKTLPDFFSQWLDQTGIPVLDVRWRNESHEDHARAVLSIFQSQPGTPYSLPLELELRTRKGILIKEAQITGVETQLVFDLPGELVGVVLDPNHKLLLWKSEYGAAPVPMQ
jgi:hypothetical protein